MLRCWRSECRIAGTAFRMADLRALITELGYADVRTLLNSGNVVFSGRSASAQDAAVRIQDALARKLAVKVRVLVVTAAELSLVIAENTLLQVADNPSRLLVAVLSDPSHRSKLLPLLKKNWGKDALGIGSRAAYLWCSEGVIASELNAAVNRALGEAVTSRNWATILKLRALAAG